MIVQLIEKQFPIYQYREEADPLTGNVITGRVVDAAGNPEINRENQRRQHALLDRVADLDFPQNPLDAGFSFWRQQRGRDQRPHPPLRERKASP
jgi:hypothetical protein